jgi:hypothetical protein
METPNRPHSDQGVGLDALRDRIEACALAGGAMYTVGELRGLVAAARGNAENQLVPAEVLFGAMSLILELVRGRQETEPVPLRNDVAGALASLADTQEATDLRLSA